MVFDGFQGGVRGPPGGRLRAKEDQIGLKEMLKNDLENKKRAIL